MGVLNEERVATGLWLGLGVGLLALMALLSSVLTPFALGAVMAYLLVPGVAWLQRRHLPRWAATLAMMRLTALVRLGLVLILVPVLPHDTGALRAQWPALITPRDASAAPRR